MVDGEFAPAYDEKTDLEALLSKYFDYVLLNETEVMLEYIVRPRLFLSIEESFEKAYEELVSKSYQSFLLKRGEDYILRIIKVKFRVKPRKVLSAVLLALTVASVYVTGYFVTTEFNRIASEVNKLGASIQLIDPYVGALFFTGVILVPILLHELGHFITAMKSKVPTSFPLPIPAPLISPLGTFGAIIEMKYLPKNLRELAKLGISGPLVGTVTSLAAFAVTFYLSPTISIDVARKALEEGLLGILTFSPAGVLAVSHVIRAQQDYVTILTPQAQASFLLVLIHFANLLPIGQLDGGHVARALTSLKTHRVLSVASTAAMFAISLIFRPLMWLAFFAFLAFFLTGARPHYGAANLTYKLRFKDKVVFLAIYLFLISLTLPLPIT